MALLRYRPAGLDVSRYVRVPPDRRRPRPRLPVRREPPARRARRRGNDELLRARGRTGSEVREAFDGTAGLRAVGRPFSRGFVSLSLRSRELVRDGLRLRLLRPPPPDLRHAVF